MVGNGRSGGLMGLRVLLAAALWAVVITGCSSAGRSGGESAALFREGRYAAAYQSAVATYESSSGPAKDEAALLAGLSAHAMKDYTQAERWLRPLRFNANPEISGRASAALGLIAQEQDRHEEAARLLVAAGEKLHGEESARAYLFAAENYQAVGRTESAKLYYGMAKSRGTQTSDTEVEQVAKARLGVAGYTVQIGAFASRANADQAAAKVRARAVELGLGEPRVVPRIDRTGAATRTLYAVQVGDFPTRQQAEASNARLGAGGVVVARTT